MPITSQYTTDHSRYGKITSFIRRRQNEVAVKSSRPRYWYISTKPVSAKKMFRVQWNGNEVALVPMLPNSSVVEVSVCTKITSAKVVVRIRST